MTKELHQWMQKYCGYCMSETDNSNVPDCACDECGRFDMRYMTKCTIENCIPLKEYKMTGLDRNKELEIGDEVVFIEEVTEHLSEDGFPLMVLGKKGDKAVVSSLHKNDRMIYVKPLQGCRKGQEIFVYLTEIELLTK